MSRLMLIAAAAAMVLGVSGCGEKPAVTVYKQGTYQGKPDGRPWENDRFKGDQAAWEKSLKARNESQNEYVRIGG